MPKLPTACVLSFVVLLTLSAAACSRPEPPPTDQPPEPQAAASDAAAPRRGALTEAIQAPIDKAKAVEGTVLDAAEQQKAEIDAQTGG